MQVLLYDGPADREPSEVIALDPAKDGWGDISSILGPTQRMERSTALHQAIER